MHQNSIQTLFFPSQHITRNKYPFFFSSYNSPYHTSIVIIKNPSNIYYIITMGIKGNDEMLLSIRALEIGEENSDRVKSIREITRYEFKDPVLLQQAFTHYSYEEGCSSLERLAYNGDAVLDLGVAKDQYFLYPDLDPGRLTRLRAANVDTEKLARVALKHELHALLRHNIPLLGVQIKEFREAIAKHPLHSSGLVDAPKVLADIVESLIGAIYIDSGCSFDVTWEVVKRLLEPMITPATLPIHPVTKLQELCQGKRMNLKMRDTWKEDGVVEFLIDDKCVGMAEYKAKRAIAKNRAALVAYNHIVRTMISFDPCMVSCKEVTDLNK